MPELNMDSYWTETKSNMSIVNTTHYNSTAEIFSSTISNIINTTPQLTYSFIFPFESADVNKIVDGIMTGGFKYPSYAIGIVYLITVFGIQHLMRNRKKFELKKFAIFWNIFLMFLNGLASCRLIPYILHVLRYYELYESICINQVYIENQLCGFWLRFFLILKVLELGDTVLIVLQKRKLLAYFWCHHLGVLWISLYMYYQTPTLSMWMVFTLYVCHVPIYLYGTCKACGISTPKIVPTLLLLWEIFQLVVIDILIGLAFYYLHNGQACNMPKLDAGIIFCFTTLCLLLSAAIMHQKFFIQSKTFVVQKTPVVKISTVSV